MKDIRSGLRFLAVMIFIIVSSSESASARPITLIEAEKAAQAWLTFDPLNFKGGSELKPRDTKVSRAGKDPAFYAVALSPAGFIVLSADDQIEPVVCFSASGYFEPGDDGPLDRLLAADLSRRLNGISKPLSGFPMKAAEQEAQKKWSRLLKVSAAGSLENISDPRVDPFVLSRWSQGAVANRACFNYYTPPGLSGDANNYSCGCVATAFAQLLRFHRLPKFGIGVNEFHIIVDGEWRYGYSRGGDGTGGPYDWDSMPLIPNSATTEKERQALGALTHDLSSMMMPQYSRSGTGGNYGVLAQSIQDYCGFGNASFMWAYEEDDTTYDLNADFFTAVNSNLDAGLPVIMAIVSTVYSSNHAILCDGYGYVDGTIYHHENFGWNGLGDLWYNLPTLKGTAGYNYNYDLVAACLYNIFPSGTGQVVSGRIFGAHRRPLGGVKVTAESSGRIWQTTSNDRGIYAFVGIPTLKECRFSAEGFGSQVVQISGDVYFGMTSGNIWGLDFPPPSKVWAWTKYE
jgi:hypothetical protein